MAAPQLAISKCDSTTKIATKMVHGEQDTFRRCWACKPNPLDLLSLVQTCARPTQVEMNTWCLHHPQAPAFCAGVGALVVRRTSAQAQRCSDASMRANLVHVGFLRGGCPCRNMFRNWLKNFRDWFKRRLRMSTRFMHGTRNNVDLRMHLGFIRGRRGTRASSFGTSRNNNRVGYRHCGSGDARTSLAPAPIEGSATTSRG